MAWYYGFNKSDLYGSNFSTVLADAPPPLDDTEEEDNDIVFRNQGKKLETKSEKPVSPLLKKLYSQSSGDESNFDITSKSPVDDQFSSDDKPSDQDKEVHNDQQPESDFGDFAGFADFNSAFGQENGDKPSNQAWFNSEGNGSFVINGELEMTENTQITDDRNVNKCTYDNEVVSNGRSPENGSVRSLNQSKVWSNKSSSSCSSHEVDSDDDFGDFSSVISNHGSSESVTLEENGVKGTKKSSEMEARASGNESFDNGSQDHGIIQHSNSGTKQFGAVCISDENSEHQQETNASGHDEKSGFDVPHTIGNEKECLDTNTLCEEDEDFEGLVSFSYDPKNSGDEDPCSDSEHGFIGEDHGSHIEKHAVDNHYGKITTSLPLPHDQEEVSKSDTQTSPTKRELKDRQNVICNNSGTATSKEELSKQKLTQSPTSKSIPDKSYSDSCNVNRDVETMNSINSDVGEDFISSTTQSQRHLNLVAENPEGSRITGLKNQLESYDSFGEFSDFNSSTEQSTTSLKGLQIHSQDPETDDVNVPTNSLCHSDQDDKEKSLNGTESKDYSDIGELNSSDFQLRSSLQGTSNVDSFGNFGTFDFKPGKSTTKLKVADNFGNEFGEFGDFSAQTGDSLNQYDNDDKFGAFRAFASQPDSESEKEESDDLKADDAFEEDQNSDSFGDFGRFDSNAEHSSTRVKNEDDKFGDYGSFASPIVSSSKQNDSADSFGDFSAFDCQSKNPPNNDHKENNFVGCVTFESSIKDSQTENQSADDFGNFGVFDSQSKCVDDFGHFESPNTGESPTEQNLVKDDFGDFDAFGTQNPSFNTQNLGEFGDFSDANASDYSGFADFSSLQHSKGVESTLGENVDMNIHKIPAVGNKAVHGSTDERTRANLQSHQWNTLNEAQMDKLFTPGSSVIVAQAEKPVSLCFSVPGLTTDGASSNCDVLASLIEKDMQSSNSKVWHHLETSKEGKVMFSWANSFSKHKKYLSLNVRPEKSPAQLGSVLKPQMASFGGGLRGSILVPEPTSKLHRSVVTSGLLEPIRGSAEPVAYSVQNKNPSKLSVHPELALPDLSFVLSGGLKQAASKSDIKDNLSDTASESSSLDLDFFVPLTSAPSSDSKTDSRGLYEEDLLGLNIMSSEEFQKTDSFNPPKASGANKVWQHGGVTIPLASKEKRTQLSVVAKRIIDQLEDLRFMNSSVLMFPLKCE